MAQFRNWLGMPITPRGGKGSNPYNRRYDPGMDTLVYEGSDGNWIEVEQRFRGKDWREDLNRARTRASKADEGKWRNQLIEDNREERDYNRGVQDRSDQRQDRSHDLNTQSVLGALQQGTQQLANQTDEIKNRNRIDLGRLELEGSIAENHLAISNRNMENKLVLGQRELDLRETQMDLNTQATNVEIGQKQKLMGMSMLNNGFANAISALQGRVG